MDTKQTFPLKKFLIALIATFAMGFFAFSGVIAGILLILWILTVVAPANPLLALILLAVCVALGISISTAIRVWSKIWITRETAK